MTDLREALVEAGLAKKDDAEKAMKATEAKSVPSVVPEVEFSQREIEDGAVFLEIFGCKAVTEILEGERAEVRPYGFGRGKEALKDAMDRALGSKSVSEGERLERAFFGTRIMVSRRARDFDEGVEILLAVIASGRSRQWLGEQKAAKKETKVAEKKQSLVVPDFPELSKQELLDSKTRQTAVTVYREKVETWRKGLTMVQLRAVGEPSVYSLEEKFRRFLDDQVKEVKTGIAKKAIEDFDSGKSTVVEFKEGLKRISKVCGYDYVKDAFHGSQRAWEAYISGFKGFPESGFPNLFDLSQMKHLPSQDFLCEILDLKVLAELLSGAAKDHREVIREWTLQVLPEMAEDQGYFFIRNNGKPAVFTSDGSLHEKWIGPRWVPQAEGVYSLEENPDGWLLREVFGRGKSMHYRWCGPEVFEKLQIVRKARRGNVCFRGDVIDAYERHERRGYPRFTWSVRAGFREYDFELPVQTFRDGDGELARRLDALKWLKEHALEELIPGKAWWINAKLGKTKSGRPKLTNANDGTTKAMLFVESSSARSGGKWGWKGETVLAKESEDVEILSNRKIHSKGGGAASAKIIALIPEGKTLRLSNGEGVFFDGKEPRRVPGAGLDDAQNPSLD